MAILKLALTRLIVAALFLVILMSSSRTMSTTQAARIIVGGSARWTFGFNYTNWAMSNAPFYQNDTLVFMYDPPNPNGTAPPFPHSVYLMKNLRRFAACDLKKATAVGGVMQGGGGGLEFVLRKRKPHYFACGERGGLHCNVGLMKFAVLPTRRPRNACSRG